MNKEEIYHLLEEKMLGYLDYIEVPIQPNGEPLLPIRSEVNLKIRQIDPHMLPLTGEQIYVRQTVVEKLQHVASLLQEYDPSLILEVVYGYRSLDIQRQLFKEKKAELKDKFSGTALLEATHKYIAVPEVAGHPTGGAVDVQLIRGQAPLDFGTKIWEFAEDSFTFSPFIKKEAWCHRQLLRRIMMSAGFAPFDGEWWHFSYGDKEWAKYYGKPCALYEQLEIVYTS